MVALRVATGLEVLRRECDGLVRLHADAIELPAGGAQQPADRDLDGRRAEGVCDVKRRSDLVVPATFSDSSAGRFFRGAGSL